MENQKWPEKLGTGEHHRTPLVLVFFFLGLIGMAMSLLFFFHHIVFLLFGLSLVSLLALILAVHFTADHRTIGALRELYSQYFDYVVAYKKANFALKETIKELESRK